MKRIFILAFVLCSSYVLQAQFSRHIIQLKDKKGTAYTPAAPSAYLSPKALERRSRQHIAIDSTDLPVSIVYLDSIRHISNVTVLNVSKWLNQVLIRTTDSGALATIRSFSFVRLTAPVAVRKATAGNTTAPFIETTSPLSSASPGAQARSMAATFDYGASFNQVHIHNGEFLHTLGFSATGITIAILDAGFSQYKTNPALDSVRALNHVLGERDYVTNDGSVNEDAAHGATCFTIFAANRPGIIVGTAPHASFWLLRTEDAASEYPVEEQNWAAAAELADSAGADIISTSLGYVDFDDHSFDHSYADRNGHTAIITRAANMAFKKGMIVTASAGNTGASSTENKYVNCPADGDSVLAVGATNNTGIIASFSSWGPNSSGQVKPDIASVGQGTVSADPLGNPVSSSGTSFANPNVCGLIACLWQAFPALSNRAIIDAVKKSSHQYDHPDDRYGYGIPDFKKAFILLAARSFAATINVSQCMATFSFSGRDYAAVQYQVQKKNNTTNSFNTIATIRSKGNSSGMNDYTFNDLVSGIAAGGQITYRINEVFGDTAVQVYTNTITLAEACAAVNKLIIRPNPVTRDINLVVGTVQPVSQLGITVIDMKGSLVYRWKGQKETGNFYLTIPADALSHGVYIVTARDGNKRLFTQKIVK